MKSILILMLMVTGWTAKAADYEVISLSNGFDLKPGKVVTLNLATPRYIKNLVVQAESIGSGSSAQVIVNGEVKGDIYAPGSDPSFVVTVAATASSVQIRHLAGSAIRIIGVNGSVSNSWASGGFRGDVENLKGLVRETLDLINAIDKYASPTDQATYLMPIKKSAGYILVMSSAHGNLGKDTIARLHMMVGQIDSAVSYLHYLMETEAAFDLVVQLLTVKESVRELLN